MKNTLMAALLVFAALNASPGAATHCNPGEDDVAKTMVDVGSEETVRVYVVHEYVYDYTIENHYFVYVESNGIDGLQRRDWYDDNTCRGAIQPDMWISPFAGWVPNPLA